MKMIPLLKTLCGAKVVVLLSSHPDVKNRIFTAADDYLDEKERRKELKADLRIKFSNMFSSFPPNLINSLPLDLALFIGKEMVRYEKLLKSKFGLTQEFSRNFIKFSIFSSNGTIDEELAARELLKEPNLSTSVLFKVACYYCLEDFILTVWEKQPILRGKLDIKDRNNSEFSWIRYLEEKEKYSKRYVNVKNCNALPKFLLDLLCLAIDDDNFAAVKYVWKTIDKSNEFQNYRENTRQKCIVIFNKFCKKWISKLWHKFVKDYDFSESFQFCANFYRYGNILKFIFSRMTIEEIKDLLSIFKGRYPITYCILFIFLNYPYQDQFMDMAESFFCILSKYEYYGLMHNMLNLIIYGNYDMPYSYRLLLKEFWIKSPLHLKKQVINLEQINTKASDEFSLDHFINECFLLLYFCAFIDSPKKILEKLILDCNFTPDDKYNFLMILKTATPQEKKSIFKFQGKLICDKLISRGDCKLTDFFLQSLNVDDETQQSFKKDLVIKNFLEVVKLQRLNLITQLIKWGFSPGEIKTIKQEIFYVWFEFNTIADLYMKSDIVISFLDEIYKFLSNIDEIGEWKQNGAFDVKFVESLVYEYCKPDRFDQFLKWICYTEEEISVTKENLLLIILENELFLDMPTVELPELENITKMISYLCSYNRDKISEFVITLLAIFETYAEKNACRFCYDDEDLYYDSDESGFICRDPYHEAITFKRVDHIHSYFIKELDSLDAGRKKEGNIV